MAIVVQDPVPQAPKSLVHAVKLALVRRLSTAIAATQSYQSLTASLEQAFQHLDVSVVNAGSEVTRTLSAVATAQTQQEHRLLEALGRAQAEANEQDERARSALVNINAMVRRMAETLAVLQDEAHTLRRDVGRTGALLESTARTGGDASQARQLTDLVNDLVRRQAQSAAAIQSRLAAIEDATAQAAAKQAAQGEASLAAFVKTLEAQLDTVRLGVAEGLDRWLASSRSEHAQSRDAMAALGAGLARQVVDLEAQAKALAGRVQTAQVDADAAAARLVERVDAAVAKILDGLAAQEESQTIAAERWQSSLSAATDTVTADLAARLAGFERAQAQRAERFDAIAEGLVSRLESVQAEHAQNHHSLTAQTAEQFDVVDRAVGKILEGLAAQEQAHAAAATRLETSISAASHALTAEFAARLAGLEQANDQRAERLAQAAAGLDCRISESQAEQAQTRDALAALVERLTGAVGEAAAQQAARLDALEANTPAASQKVSADVAARLNALEETLATALNQRERAFEAALTAQLSALTTQIGARFSGLDQAVQRQEEALLDLRRRQPDLAAGEALNALRHAVAQLGGQVEMAFARQGGALATLAEQIGQSAHVTDRTGRRGVDAPTSTPTIKAYYGQFNPPQDQILYERFFKKLTRPGVVVEAGAFDGVTESCSKMFEESLHWRAINIEASPPIFKLLQANRPASINLNLALSDKTGSATFQHVVHPTKGEVFGNGSLRHADAHLKLLKDDGCTFKQYVVPTRTFAEVVADLAAPSIDLFVLDVEGFEAEVTRGMVGTPVWPSVICLEHGLCDLAACLNVLLDQGYRVHSRVHNNIVLVNESWEGG